VKNKNNKIKKIKPRDFNIKKMMENPKKSGAHLDKKKQYNKDACDDDLEEYLFKRLRDPYFAKEYQKALEDIEKEKEEAWIQNMADKEDEFGSL
jgi:hypothetical protein